MSSFTKYHHVFFSPILQMLSIFQYSAWSNKLSFEFEPRLIQKHFSPAAGGLRCTNGRALRHPYRDFLVPYLTVNGFGRLINSDEWEPIHNPLCTWPSVLQDLKNGCRSRERPTTAPCWPGSLTGSTGKRVSSAADFQKRQN